MDGDKCPEGLAFLADEYEITEGSTAGASLGVPGNCCLLPLTLGLTTIFKRPTHSTTNPKDARLKITTQGNDIRLGGGRLSRRLGLMCCGLECARAGPGAGRKPSAALSLPTNYRFQNV